MKCDKCDGTGRLDDLYNIIAYGPDAKIVSTWTAYPLPDCCEILQDLGGTGVAVRYVLTKVIS